MNPQRPRLDLHSPWHLTLVFLVFGLAGWLLQASPALEFDVDGDGGIAQVFHSPDGHWNEANSVPTVVLPGSRTVSLRLPWSLPERLRFDPIAHAGSVTIRQVRYQYLLFRHVVAPDDISGLREPVAQGVTPGADGSLRLHAYDDDPQLSVPTPPLASWRVAGLLLALLPIGLAMGSLRGSQLRGGRSAAFASSVALAGMAFAALVYLVGWSEADLPILDDWRYFHPGRFSLIEGHAAWLGIASNDTYFLTGQLLDWALLGLTGGDTRALRVFALGLLAPFLALAAALAWRHAPRWAPAAVLGTTLTLAARAYWSQQFVAYHQFLPVLALFAVLWIVGRNQLTYTPAQRGWLVFWTLVAGLAYVSGALLFVTVALAWMAARPATLNPSQYRGHPVAWYVGIPALLTLAVQLWLVTTTQGSLVERSHAGEMSWPTQERFWAFMAGLFGRTAGIPDGWLAFDALVLLSMILLGGCILVHTVGWHFRRDDAPDPAAAVSLVLFAGAFAYAALVAAGRAALGTESADAVTIANIAKWRFHYWWLAAMLPLGAAIALDVLSRGRRGAMVFMAAATVALAMTKMVTFVRNDVPYFAYTREEARTGAACVRAAIIGNGGLDGPIRCPSYYPGDIAPAVRSAYEHKLAFARTLLQLPAR
jgi:hypothetical protein